MNIPLARFNDYNLYTGLRNVGALAGVIQFQQIFSHQNVNPDNSEGIFPKLLPWAISELVPNGFPRGFICSHWIYRKDFFLQLIKIPNVEWCTIRTNCLNKKLSFCYSKTFLN